MRKVVSVSLGSSRGDKTVHVSLLGEDFEISRKGTNGDMAEFARLVREIDGNVDAIGLGGIDLYLVARNRKYVVRDAARLAANAKVSPVVDGSGIKNTIERSTIEWLQERGIVDFPRKKVLIVCGVDRFGMAEAIAERARAVVFGDLMFNVGVPIPVRSLKGIQAVAAALLPLVCRLPFKWLYPTGAQQEKITPRHEKHFAWADVIAGDYKIIGRFMPSPESGALRGKTVITNTLTSEDVENLRERGVRLLITATLEFEGRTFATNALEGVIITLSGKRPEEMRPEDYLSVLRRLDWKPTVRDLQADRGNG